MPESKCYDNYQIVIKKKYKLLKISENEYYLHQSSVSLPDIKLNAPAAIIWQLCLESITFSELISYLVKYFDASAEELTKDTLNILAKLCAENLITFKQLKPEIDNRFALISHRRSGTHFLWELMRTNLGVGTTRKNSLWDIPKSHEKYSTNKMKWCQNRMTLYIVRDCRDVLVANYNYFRNGGEKNLGMKNILQHYSIGEFIRGQVPIESHVVENSQFLQEYFSDPVNYWIEHTRWAEQLFTIKFEDIITDAVSVLTQIAEEFQLNFEEKDYIPLDGLVGHLPRKGVVGDWQSWFTEDDLVYVETIAGQRLTQLGYTISSQQD